MLHSFPRLLTVHRTQFNMAYQQKIIQGDDPSVIRLYGERTANTSCQYLLPHITKTANILDVGCGPGIITADLAKIASEGHTIGVDNSEGIIKQASTAFSDIPNLNFQVADGTNLKDFADNSFDIVHAHQILVHIANPVVVMKEFYRVCKPGGIIACRESNSAVVLSLKPDLPGLREYWAKVLATMPKIGAQPEAGANLEKWAKEAGFDANGGKIISTKSPIWNAGHIERVTGANAEQAIQYGMATKEETERWAAAWREWEATEGHEWISETGEILCWKA